MNLRHDFAQALAALMHKRPATPGNIRDYLEDLKRLAAGYGAKRDRGDSTLWRLPDGSTVTLEDLQAAYRGDPLPEIDDDLDFLK